jgi:nucleotide-binding universal stress UspA family protein
MDRQAVVGSKDMGWPGFAQGPVYIVGPGTPDSVLLAGKTFATWLGRETVAIQLDRERPMTATLANAAVAVMKCPEAGTGQYTLDAPVLALAKCPLLMVPGRLPVGWPGDGPILAPLDGSDDAAVGAEAATILARCASRDLEVLHVAESATGASGPVKLPRFADQAYHEMRAWRHAFITRYGGDANSHTPLIVRSGSPVNEILEVARQRQAAMIVLAWHGDLTTGRARTLAGVIDGAEQPVLLMRTNGLSRASASFLGRVPYPS